MNIIKGDMNGDGKQATDAAEEKTSNVGDYEQSEGKRVQIPRTEVRPITRSESRFAINYPPLAPSSALYAAQGSAVSHRRKTEHADSVIHPVLSFSGTFLTSEERTRNTGPGRMERMAEKILTGSARACRHELRSLREPRR